MPYLHNQPERFEEYVAACAATAELPRDFVVKDYYVTMMLKEMLLSNPLVVFKGGTSLSKSHGIIERFSEDIDVGTELTRPTEGQRKLMKSAVVSSAERLGLEISNLGETRSKRAFNRFMIPIPGFDGDPGNTLIVETALQTPIQPTVEKTIDSYIRRFMASSALEDEIPLFGLEPFVMKVSSIERTFIDKVFAICDYYLSGDSMERQSRHIYDLYKMMDHVDLNDPLADLFKTVRVQRKGLYGCLSAEDGADVAGILQTIVESDAYRLDYERVTSPLLYEDVSYETAIEALPAIAGFLSRRGRFS